MDNVGSLLQRYGSELKNNLLRIVKSPLYISLFVLFLLSGGSSAYILFSSHNNAPVIVPPKQPSGTVVIAHPTPTDALLPVTTNAPLVSPTDSPTPTPVDPTTSWRTYTNTTYGYSIKYPPDWVASDSGQLEPLIPSYILFNPIGSSAASRSITISYTTRTSAQLGAIYGIAGKQMTVDNFSATEYNETDSDGNQTTTVIFPVGINALLFFSQNQYEATLMNMLGTFKLTN